MSECECKLTPADMTLADFKEVLNRITEPVTVTFTYPMGQYHGAIGPAEQQVMAEDLLREIQVDHVTIRVQGSRFGSDSPGEQVDIEFRKVEERTADKQEFCSHCGHTLIRSGTAFRCMNCGNTGGVS